MCTKKATEARIFFPLPQKSKKKEDFWKGRIIIPEIHLWVTTSKFFYIFWIHKATCWRRQGICNRAALLTTPKHILYVMKKKFENVKRKL